MKLTLFSVEEANRLAFWRWLAAQRGETEERTIAGGGAVPKGAATQREPSCSV